MTKQNNSDNNPDKVSGIENEPYISLSTAQELYDEIEKLKKKVKQLKKKQINNRHLIKKQKSNINDDDFFDGWNAALDWILNKDWNKLFFQTLDT